MTETVQGRDRRADRHAATKREILEATWRLARERGLGGWSLRDVAGAVGMRAPSLYVYFDSKNALYDAMFAEGNAELLRRTDAVIAGVQARRLSPAEALRTGARSFVEFCIEDPPRHQLLFLRTVPGFEPSEPSYALAREALDRLAEVLSAAGVGAPEQVDLWTALISGLATQQLSNDPGGDRWRRLVDPAVEMFLAAHLPSRTRGGASGGSPPTIEQ
ncbi:MAG: TetR/AcrR family transcriptional regulator [Actinomycetota bacterium]|nr:TetR/AcrR family transcriptional regulator [Actinomycetota bacterium]